LASARAKGAYRPGVSDCTLELRIRSAYPENRGVKEAYQAREPNTGIRNSSRPSSK
jgi:hypothetical protein